MNKIIHKPMLNSSKKYKKIFWYKWHGNSITCLHLVQTQLCSLYCTWVLDKKSIKVSAAAMTAISFSFNEFGAFFAYPDCRVLSWLCFFTHQTFIIRKISKTGMKFFLSHFLIGKICKMDTKNLRTLIVVKTFQLFM